ncbi:hypothetical protein A2U01_0018827, partial [Trifolium medium]|nr:hypothetical protein [Trifolium medium]
PSTDLPQGAVPIEHQVVQSPLNEVLPSTDLPQGAVPLEHQVVQSPLNQVLPSTDLPQGAVPIKHQVVQSPFNEVLPSTDLPQGAVPIKYQDVNCTSLDKIIFESELETVKGVVRILDDGKKNYLRKQSHSLEPFEIVFKHHFDDLLGKLQRLKKTAAELNHFNGACDISELINQLMLMCSLA